MSRKNISQDLAINGSDSLGVKVPSVKTPSVKTISILGICTAFLMANYYFLKKKAWFITLSAVLGVFSQSGFGKIHIPSIFVTLPVMLVLLPGVILIESLVLRRVWEKVSFKSIMLSSVFGNVASILIGVPMVWCLYYWGITISAELLILTQAISISAGGVIDTIISASVVDFFGDSSGAYRNFMLLLVPTYFLSYKIKSLFYREEEIGKQNIKAGVRLANRWSYVFIVLATTIWFVATVSQNGGWLSSVLRFWC